MPNMIEHRTSGEVAASADASHSSVARQVQIAVVGVLLITAFWQILAGMYGSWFDEHAYMEHGILVFPAAAYMVWTKRSKLKQIPPQASVWGVFLLLIGAFQATLGLAA